MMQRRFPATVLAVVVALSPPAFPQPAGVDPDIAKGIQLVEDGEYDAAIVVLDAATRRLAAAGGPSRALGEGFLYLGVAYLAKGHEITARARFREALGQVHDLRLSAEKFAPKVMEVFEAARQEAERTRSGPAAVPSPSPAVGAPPKKAGGSGKTLLLAGAGVAVAAAALAASSGGGGSSPTTRPTVTYRLDPADSQFLTQHGGGGGRLTALVCPSGSVMTGILGGDTGVTLTRIGIICRTLNADGTTGTDTTVPAVGGLADGSPFTESCDPNQVVVHLFGSVATLSGGLVLVSSLGIACAPVAAWVEGTATVTRKSVHGGPGSTFTDPCPPSYVVTQLNAETGSLVDRVQGVCTRVRR